MKMNRTLTEIFEKKKGVVENVGKKISEEKNGMNHSLKKRYDAISKNGDTLELSDEGKAMKKENEAEKEKE